MRGVAVQGGGRKRHWPLLCLLDLLSPKGAATWGAWDDPSWPFKVVGLLSQALSIPGITSPSSVKLLIAGAKSHNRRFQSMVVTSKKKKEMRRMIEKLYPFYWDGGMTCVIVSDECKQCWGSVLLLLVVSSYHLKKTTRHMHFFCRLVLNIPDVHQRYRHGRYLSFFSQCWSRENSFWKQSVVTQPHGAAADVIFGLDQVWKVKDVFELT